MTKRIRLSYGSEVSSTAVSNIFIDEYMAEANGAYVKVYVYLLRCLNDPAMSFSVAGISDKLDETEKDIVKALRYWEKKKLLSIAWDCDGEISSITINPLNSSLPEDDDNIITLAPSAPKASKVPVSETADTGISERTVPTVITKPNYTARQLAQFRDFDEFNTLVDYIEERLGCTLTTNDLQTPAFLYESLGMSPELIRYLYDFCSFKGKATGAYIEKVAVSWNEKGIDSIDKARSETFSRSKECSAVKAAFGFNRNLGAIELQFVDRWRLEYRMSSDLISEACNRTMLAAKGPDFTYADRILSGWHEAGVSSLDDLAPLDAAHKARSNQTRKDKTATSANKFNQFPQRTYSMSDYSDLERRKLNIQ